jgi:CheY-like chemotaxis protein
VPPRILGFEQFSASHKDSDMTPRTPHTWLDKSEIVLPQERLWALPAPISHVPPRLMAQLSERIASDLAPLAEALRHAALNPVDLLDPEPLRAVALGVAQQLERLEGLGLQVQQLARVLAHGATADPETLDLQAAVAEALPGWQPAASEAPVPVHINAAVLDRLLVLAIEAAMDQGTEIELRIERASAASNVVRLTLLASSPPGASPPGGNDPLPWLMLAQLARAAGLMPQRETEPQWRLSLGFPASHREGSGPFADLAHPPVPSPAELPRTPTAVGCRVLIVDPSAPSRQLARDLLLAAGVHADAVASVEQARSTLADAWPDVLLIGLPLSHTPCRELVDEMLAHRPHLRVIELVDTPDRYSVSLPELGLPGALSRADLSHTLVQAVAHEAASARIDAAESAWVSTQS